MSSSLSPKSASGEIKTVAKGAAIAMALKVIAAALNFAFNVVIARFLGATGAGAYFLAFTIVTVVSTVARIGLDNVSLRWVANCFAVGDVYGIKKIYWRVLLLSTLSAVICTASLYCLSPWFSNVVFSNPVLHETLQIMAFAVPFICIYTLHAQMLQGLRLVRDAIFLLSVVVPMCSICFLLLFGKSDGIEGASGAYVFACMFAALLGGFVWKRLRFEQSANFMQGVTFTYAQILRNAGPLLVVAVLQMIIAWGSALLIGVWCDSAIVAVFNVVVRTANLMTFIQIALNAVVAPRFAAMHHMGDMEALKKLSRSASRMATVFASVPLLAFVFFPEKILHLFGGEYEVGMHAMQIIAVGQFVNVSTGSVGYLLSMSGNEKALRDVTVVSALLCIVLNICLVPMWGLIGAAISYAMTIAAQNLMASQMVYQKLGFYAFGVFR